MTEFSFGSGSVFITTVNGSEIGISKEERLIIHRKGVMIDLGPATLEAMVSIKQCLDRLAVHAVEPKPTGAPMEEWNEVPRFYPNGWKSELGVFFPPVNMLVMVGIREPDSKLPMCSLMAAWDGTNWRHVSGSILYFKPNVWRYV